MRGSWSIRLAWAWALASATGVPLAAQTGGTCVPVSERAGRALGCFITAVEQLGELPREPALYWHLDTYPTRAAATAARGARGTVVESLGHVWLFTIAENGWRATGGTRVAQIGPLPLANAKTHAAVYMEGAFAPGMQTVVHRHAGPEAWYTLEGAMCVETSEGTAVQRAGDPGIIVREGLPMRLTGAGAEVRRSVVLILQDATKPRSTPATDWAPKGLCKP
jgi:quercetin dioxygenase-like cupin family protein